MIEGTKLEALIDSAFDGLDRMLGVSRRAREADGTYRADDPSTVKTNEAYTSGKSPTNKVSVKKKSQKKKVSKKK
ncbi:MAG: hypothetical protein HN962_02375 [Actinobacteria bacterium]|jgi:hypothetical protein|nr:hypothetical protein [Actinomycetota bacterium]